jgi:DNA-binding NarL/FixJ family response regulator
VAGRDVITAIHLAARGSPGPPRSAASGGGVDSLNLEGSDLLTPREAEVLDMLQDGATNAQIAERLTIGIETVRTHARNIYRKLGIRSRRDLPRLTRQEPVVVDDERRPVRG